MKATTYRFKTAMGTVSQFFGHPLHFLSDKEKEEFDEIGYTGKLNDVKISRTEYLNSLNKGTFDIVQTKFDNGDFQESFIISRAEL